MTNLAPPHIIVILAVAVVAISMIAAVIDTFRDNSLSVGTKVWWALLIVLIPGLGLLVWTAIRLARRGSVRYTPRLGTEER